MISEARRPAEAVAQLMILKVKLPEYGVPGG